jgi:hypothetical protein
MRAAVQSAYRALVADAKRQRTAPPPLVPSAPSLPSASSLEARATADSEVVFADSIVVEEGSIEVGPSAPLEVSVSDILDEAALLAQKRGEPPPVPTAAEDASGTMYREALLPSLVVEVSFAEDVVPASVHR